MLEGLFRIILKIRIGKIFMIQPNSRLRLLSICKTNNKILQIKLRLIIRKWWVPLIKVIHKQIKMDKIYPWKRVSWNLNCNNKIKYPFKIIWMFNNNLSIWSILQFLILRIFLQEQINLVIEVIKLIKRLLFFYCFTIFQNFF